MLRVSTVELKNCAFAIFFLKEIGERDSKSHGDGTKSCWRWSDSACFVRLQRAAADAHSPCQVIVRHAKFLALGTYSSAHLGIDGARTMAARRYPLPIR